MTTVLEIKNLTKTYVIDDTKQNVLENVNLDILQGELILLRGDNGSGKTTLVNLILGLQSPDSGSIAIFGKPPQDPSSRLKVGAMLQRAKPVDNLRVKETIELFRSYYSDPLDTQDILNRTRLINKQNDDAATLAGGQAQSLYFALAISGNPELLIFDEPTNNLAQEARQNFWKQVREFNSNGKTIIVITHNQQDCDEIQDIVSKEVKLELTNGKIEEVSSERYQKLAKSQKKSPKLPLCVRTNTENNNAFFANLLTPITWISNLVKSRAFWGQLYVEMLQIIREVNIAVIYLAFAIFLGCIAGKITQGSNEISFRSSISISLILLFFLVTINQFSVKIASERDRGWLKLLRISPLSFGTYLAAKVGTLLLLLMIMSSLALISGSLFLGHSSGQQINLGLWIPELILCLFYGIIPFAVIAFAVGYLFKTQILPFITLILVIFIFLTSGFFNFQILNQGSPNFINYWIQKVVMYSPAYHWIQLVAWAGNLNGNLFRFDNYLILHILWLLWWSIMASFIARWAYLRERLSG